MPIQSYHRFIYSATVNGTSCCRNGDIDETALNGGIEHQRELNITEHVHIRAVVTVVVRDVIAPSPLTRSKGVFSKNRDLALAIMVITENKELLSDTVFVELYERPGGQGAEFFAHMNLPPCCIFVVAHRYGPLARVNLRSSLSYLRA